MEGHYTNGVVIGDTLPSSKVATMPAHEILHQLYARIAVLETQLQHAKTEAEESAQGARYLLKIQTAQSAKVQCNVSEHAGLEAQLRAAKNQAAGSDQSILTSRATHGTAAYCGILAHSDLEQRLQHLNFENHNLRNQVSYMQHHNRVHSQSSGYATADYGASTNIRVANIKRDQVQEPKPPQAPTQSSVHEHEEEHNLIDLGSGGDGEKTKVDNKLELPVHQTHPASESSTLHGDHSCFAVKPSPTSIMLVEQSPCTVIAGPAITNAATTQLLPDVETPASVSFTSMLEGRKEWAERTPKPMPATTARTPTQAPAALPIVPLSTPESSSSSGFLSDSVHAVPRRHGPISNSGADFSLSDSIHTIPRRPHGPISDGPAAFNRFPTRPDHARDEKSIRWKPRDPKMATSHRVLISNLPSNITYKDLLAAVCGGLVVSCQILSTSTLTGSNSALVRFLNNEDANAYTKHANKHPPTFPTTSGNPLTARITLLPTPTFPLNPSLLRDVRQFGHTRILEIRNFPIPISSTDAQALEDLRWFLRPFGGCKLDNVVHIEPKDNEMLRIEFTSVDAAVNAHGKFSGNSLYRRCVARFLKDPCDRIARRGLSEDEIWLDTDEESEAGGETEDEGSCVTGLMTPPDSSSDVEREAGVRMGLVGGMGRMGRRRGLGNWDYARERELQLAAVRGAPGARG